MSANVPRPAGNVDAEVKLGGPFEEQRGYARAFLRERTGILSEIEVYHGPQARKREGDFSPTMGDMGNIPGMVSRRQAVELATMNGPINLVVVHNRGTAKEYFGEDIFG